MPKESRKCGKQSLKHMEISEDETYGTERTEEKTGKKQEEIYTENSSCTSKSQKTNFGETVVLSANIVTGPACNYLSAGRADCDRKDGNGSRCSHRPSHSKPNSCKNPKTGWRILSYGSEFTERNLCKRKNDKEFRRILPSGSGRGRLCPGKICISEINEETLHFLHFVQDNLP